MARLVGPAVLAALVIGGLARWQGWLSAEAFDLMFAAAMVPTFWGLLPRLGVGSRPAAMIALGIGVGAGLAALVWPWLRLAPYLAVAGINLGVAWVFARGLVPGRQPILVQLIELMGLGPAATPDFLRFVRGQCWLWVGLGLAAGLSGLVGMVSPGLRPLLGEVIAAALISQAAVFVLSHHYARWRYHRPETWLVTARAMARPATWEALRP
ncbi:MAG: hypothetical protein AAGI70_12115 [Pseudomonadota bacterium]